MLISSQRHISTEQRILLRKYIYLYQYKESYTRIIKIKNLKKWEFFQECFWIIWKVWDWKLKFGTKVQLNNITFWAGFQLIWCGCSSDSHMNIRCFLLISSIFFIPKFPKSDQFLVLEIQRFWQQQWITVTFNLQSDI